MSEGFNKSEFSRYLAERVGVSQDDAAILWDEIGHKITSTLAAGKTVLVFGVGTLKVVKKKSVDEATRTRFRPTTRKAKAEPVVTLTDLPGIRSGVVADVVVITSASAGVRAINTGRSCHFDGRHGSLTVYRDDVGSYRCLMRRPGHANDENIVTFKSHANRWLRESFRILDSGPTR